MERYALPTHPEKACEKSDNFECLLLNKILPSLKIKVKTPFVKRRLLLGWDAVGVVGEVWGCLLCYTNLFTRHWFQRMTFHNLHAGFGLEATSLESFTSNFPFLHEAATTAWLWLAAGGGQIGLCVTRNTWSSAVTYPELHIIINRKKYQRKFSALYALPRQQTTLKSLVGEVWCWSPFLAQPLFLLSDKDGQI